MLLENWYFSKKFIETIQPYFERLNELNEEILESAAFSNFKFNYKEYKHIRFDFEKLIFEIEKNVLKLIPNYNIYNNYHDFIFKLFFKYAKENETDMDNSQVRYILSFFPSDITEAIEKNFNKKEFKNLIISKNIKPNVFFPRTQLFHHIKHIKKNIKKKLNDEKKLTDVTLNFDISKNDNNIIIAITNDLTDKDNEKNPEGGLADFKKELFIYGGNLEHRLLENNKYQIKLTFLYYDQE